MVRGAAGSSSVELVCCPMVSAAKPFLVLADPVNGPSCQRLWPSQEGVNWEAGFSPKQLKERGEASGGMWSVVVGLHHLLQVLWPLPLLLGWQSAKEVMQSAVEPLALAIALGVVQRCPGLSDVVDLAEFLDDVGLKVSPLVTMQPLWHPKPLEPVLDQHSCHSCRLLVSGWDGLRELGEYIS